MAQLSTNEVPSSISSPSQYSVRAIFIATLVTTITVASYMGFGRDGFLLAAIVSPTIAVPGLSKAQYSRLVQMTTAAVLLTLGSTWLLLFPKTWDLLRPDTFTSILFGLGLIGSGMLVLTCNRPRSAIIFTLLLASVLLNLVLWNYLHHSIALIQRLA